MRDIILKALQELDIPVYDITLEEERSAELFFIKKTLDMRRIKDGKLTGRVFSPIVLTGYVPDLLKSITMVSKDFALEGAGMCGKGWKEWVKVSDGGPCIKARIRLG